MSRACNRVAIIGFGNVGLYVAVLYLKEDNSVCVYDLESDVARVQQIMEAELPQMLNSFMFGKHLKHYSVADIRAMLKRFSVAADLDSLVSNGFKVAFECIPEVLHKKQQLFAVLTALLDQRGVAARDVLLCTCTLSLSIPSISMGAMTRYSLKDMFEMFVRDLRRASSVSVGRRWAWQQRTGRGSATAPVVCIRKAMRQLTWSSAGLSASSERQIALGGREIRADSTHGEVFRYIYSR